MTDALSAAQREGTEAREAAEVVVHGAQPRLYIQFDGFPGSDLKLESLEDRRRGIELMAVSQSRPVGEEPPVQRATVFVPDGALKHFFDRFEQYDEKQTKKGEPRHKELVDRIAALRRATVRALWTDTPEIYPGDDETVWWEIWLRKHDGQELERFLAFAEQAGLVVGERRLAFEDRIVLLARGSPNEISRSLDVLSDLAELRKAKESSALFIDAPAAEQAEWVNELKRRTTLPQPDAPAVCILDTGVTRGHPLLEDLISPTDAMAVDSAWGGHDNGGGPGNSGHGTEMAGLAA